MYQSINNHTIKYVNPKIQVSSWAIWAHMLTTISISVALILNQRTLQDHRVCHAVWLTAWLLPSFYWYSLCPTAL